jgi:hypothetical protein
VVGGRAFLQSLACCGGQAAAGAYLVGYCMVNGDVIKVSLVARTDLPSNHE